MRNLATLSVFAALFDGALGFSNVLVGQNNGVSHSNTLLHAARKSPGNIHRPENEFSRIYRVESVLGSKQRDYQASIDASHEELVELAKRFGLFNIDKLQADLVMRREPGIKGTSNRVTGVQVEGSVVAQVTQTCVRTNEKFDVDVEFPLFAIVRPLDGSANDDDDLAELQGYFEEESRGRKKKKDKKVNAPEYNVNEMDMAKLQQMLQDFDVEDDVIEDEAIYSTSGMIDLGELVSQLFWLKLDPYPKKPGTYPIRTSITG